MSVHGIPKKTTNRSQNGCNDGPGLGPSRGSDGGLREGLRFAQSIKVKVAASYKAQIAVPLQIKSITQDYSV